MNAERYQKLLNRLDACIKAYVAAEGKSLEVVWTTCERGDWLVWLADRLGITYQLVVLAVCDCIDVALQKPIEQPVVDVLSAVRRWATGNAPIEEVDAAERGLFALRQASLLKPDKQLTITVRVAGWLLKVVQHDHKLEAASQTIWLVAEVSQLSLVESADIVRDRIPLSIIEEAAERYLTEQENNPCQDQ